VVEPKQFEHDVSASVEGMKSALGIAGGLFGGGRIEHFRKGWAMAVWARGQKAHYWRRISIETIRSNCGLEVSATWTDCNGKVHPRMHGGGNFPRCKRCGA